MRLNWRTVFIFAYCVNGIAAFGFVGDRTSMQIKECREGKRPADFCKRLNDYGVLPVVLAAPFWPAVASLEAWRLVRELNTERAGAKP